MRRTSGSRRRQAEKHGWLNIWRNEHWFPNNSLPSIVQWFLESRDSCPAILDCREVISWEPLLWKSSSCSKSPLCPFTLFMRHNHSLWMNGSFADMDVPISLLVMLLIHMFFGLSRIISDRFLTCFYRNDEKSLPLADFMLLCPHFGWMTGILQLYSYQRDPQMYLHLRNSCAFSRCS